jgi:hypothetical protein
MAEYDPETGVFTILATGCCKREWAMIYNGPM